MANQLGELSAVASLNSKPYLDSIKRLGDQTKQQTSQMLSGVNAASQQTAFQSQGMRDNLAVSARLNGQPYLRNLNAMAAQTQARATAMRSTLASVATGFAGLAGIGGVASIASMLGLDLLGKAREGWQMIFGTIRGVREQIQGVRDRTNAAAAATQAMQRHAAAAQASFDARYAATVTMNEQFSRVREQLGTQVRQLGMTPAQRDADPFRTSATFQQRAEWIEEQHRILDSFKQWRDEVERSSQALRDLQSPMQSFRERLAEVLGAPRGDEGENPWLPVPGTTPDERARGVARLFESLPGFGAITPPRALERGSVESISAINAAVSQQPRSDEEITRRLDLMVQNDERLLELGRRVIAAMERNPALRALLPR